MIWLITNLLAISICAQDAPGLDRQELDRLRREVAQLQSGRPVTFTYTDLYGSITFRVSGAGLQFADGTIITSTASLTGPLTRAWAWVHFIGTGTVVIQDQVNVTSITDVNTGRYRVNFAAPFANRYFVCSCLAHRSGGVRLCEVDDAQAEAQAITPSSIDLGTMDGSATDADSDKVMVSCFGRPP